MLRQIPSLPPSTRSDYDLESSASSGRKRRRDGSPVQSTAFSQAAKNLVAMRSNVERCWNCHAPHTEFCHVIARADPAYPAMLKENMATFETLGDYRNAIALCGSCHNHFDRSSNTGWVFLPIDQGIEWVIEWEKDDFAERTEALAQSGRRTVRTYPDEGDYEKFMRMRGYISDLDDGLIRGGLYHSYILEPMFPPIMMDALETMGMEVPGVMPRDPQRWHGAIMAALNRGFLVLGTPMIKLPERTCELLQTLQRLYSRKLPTADPGQASGSFGRGGQEATQLDLEQSINPPSRQRNTHGASSNPTLLHQNLQRTTEGTREIDGAADVQLIESCSTESGPKKTRKRRRLCEDNLQTQDLDWFCFGPGSTSAQKIKSFTGIK